MDTTPYTHIRKEKSSYDTDWCDSNIAGTLADTHIDTGSPTHKILEQCETVEMGYLQRPICSPNDYVLWDGVKATPVYRIFGLLGGRGAMGMFSVLIDGQEKIYYTPGNAVVLDYAENRMDGYLFLKKRVRHKRYVIITPKGGEVMAPELYLNLQKAQEALRCSPEKSYIKSISIWI